MLRCTVKYEEKVPGIKEQEVREVQARLGAKNVTLEWCDKDGMVHSVCLYDNHGRLEITTELEGNSARIATIPLKRDTIALFTLEPPTLDELHDENLEYHD